MRGGKSRQQISPCIHNQSKSRLNPSQAAIDRSLHLTVFSKVFVHDARLIHAFDASSYKCFILQIRYGIEKYGRIKSLELDHRAGCHRRSSNPDYYDNLADFRLLQALQERGWLRAFACRFTSSLNFGTSALASGWA